MSNWTHINCSIRGTFDEKKLKELFGKPALDCDSPNQFKYESKEYFKQQRLVNRNFAQSKLPKGEIPLKYMLIKDKHYHNRANHFECYNIDQDFLTIYGDLRGFGMSNAEQYGEIENICHKIIDNFSIRQFILQAFEDDSQKEYLFYLNSDDKLQVKINDYSEINK